MRVASGFDCLTPVEEITVVDEPVAPAPAAAEPKKAERIRPDTLNASAVIAALVTRRDEIL